MKLSLGRLFFFSILAYTNTTGVYCEKINIPFATLSESIVQSYLETRKNTPQISEISMQTMQQIVILVEAVLTDAAKNNSCFLNYKKGSLNEKISIILLYLRNVLPPKHWQQEHYNGFMLAYLLVYEIAHNLKITEKLKPIMNSASKFRSSFKSMCDPNNNDQINNESSQFKSYNWNYALDKYDEEKLDKAKLTARQYIDRFKLIEFFENRINSMISDVKKSYKENTEKLPTVNTKFQPYQYDGSENIKKTALKNPTEQNVTALVNLIKSLKDKKIKKSAIRVLKILAYYDGNETARKAMYDLKLWKGKYAPLPSEKVCNSIQEYLLNKKSIDKINEKYDEDFMKCATELEHYISDVSVEDTLSIHKQDNANHEAMLKNDYENFTFSFPIRTEFLGKSKKRYVEFSVDDSSITASNYGWKIHVSARPSNAAQIMNIVLPILRKFRVHFKTMNGMQSTRSIYNRTRYKSDHTFVLIGKFITIYPNDDRQANEIAVKLDEAFKKANLGPEDFVPVPGDFQVGDTGGIYTRIALYLEEHTYDIENGQSIQDIRDIPLNNAGLITLLIMANGKNTETYYHPFKDLGLYYDDELLPQNVCELCKYLSENLYAPELTTEGYMNYHETW
ncbi:MAG: hypothetical protein LBP31_01305 [Holosporales bacterium]|jgi:hypothetical protein|nr:hypothetical protein [Holosporales bacterium]